MGLLRGDDPDALAAAARHLADGGLVAFPTETVYGLGARADSDLAVAGIFNAKGRPTNHPLIVHVSDLAQAARFATALPPSAQRLARVFWPGPVTMIVPRATGMAQAAAGGQSSIGLRCPAHPVALALLRQAAALGVAGVAGPSANRFGRVSPTNANHVVDEGVVSGAVEGRGTLVAIRHRHVGVGWRIKDRGAGGQHACGVADALGMKQVFIHPLAGVLSAYGMGLADLRLLKERAVEALLTDELIP
jgi:tRNA threonylcarbamoyl adenosine modification protein (Sua5/YciO/YrdC/YwlC family)